MKRTVLIAALLAMAAPYVSAQGLFDLQKAAQALKQAVEQPAAAQPQNPVPAQPPAQVPQTAPSVSSPLDNLIGQSAPAQQANSAATNKQAASGYEAMLGTIEPDMLTKLAQRSTDTNVVYRRTKLKEKQMGPINVFQQKHDEWLKANCPNFVDFFAFLPERYIPVAVLNEPVDQDLSNHNEQFNRKNSLFISGAARSPNQRDYQRCEGRSPKEMADLLFQRLQALRPQYEKLALQAVEDKKLADVAEANKKAEEQRQASAKAEDQKAKDAARLADLKSGKIKLATFADAALLFDPKDGDGIVSSPLVQPDKTYYKLTAELNKAEGDKWFFAIDKMGSVEKPRVMVVEQRSNVYTTRQAGGGGYERKVIGKSFFQMEKSSSTVVKGQVRLNAIYNVVGQYVDNIKVRLTNGAEETIPVFKLAYIEAL